MFDLAYNGGDGRPVQVRVIGERQRIPARYLEQIFQRLRRADLVRGSASDFKVFVGNRGDRTGAFMCVDQHFLAKGEAVAATLLYTDGDGKRQRLPFELSDRC